jgi:hypothetical protein
MAASGFSREFIKRAFRLDRKLAMQLRKEMRIEMYIPLPRQLQGFVRYGMVYLRRCEDGTG